MKRYPGATWRPSPVVHPRRPSTRGIVIHWTAGREAGDLATLTGGNVDVQFYVTKKGKVYQLLDADSQAWHAFKTANTYCIGIEHEGSGEAWTPAQLKASAKLAKWLCCEYDIPIKHVNPRTNWRGLYGHADLRGIDGNNHTDSVPGGTGWDAYVKAVKAASYLDRDKRLKALRKWILKRHDEGKSWKWIKGTHNWIESVKLKAPWVK